MTATSSSADVIGGYRLLTKIGEGGMGVVHLAQAPDGARVALKVLRPHIIGDEEARERLAREVASLRRVTSPRIAEVIDADPWADMPFVATRYVPGLSLHQHIREHGPIAGEDLRWFAAGLAEAVIAVHSVGVLHRDIKPSNVLLEGRSPVLIDFGLARLAEDPRLTHTGWLLGTPGYLAPEVLYGEDATTASDVHAWAATVAFAASGRPPFGTGPAMAIMDRVRRGEHDLSGVPGDLLPLVSEALAAEPGDRPSTGAVLAALRPAPASPVPAPAADELTLPWMLAGPPDTDATNVIDAASNAPTDRFPQGGPAGAPVAGPVSAPVAGPVTPAAAPWSPAPPDPTSVTPAATRQFTAPTPVPPAGVEPAREPYMQPPPASWTPPARDDAEASTSVPAEVVRTTGTARLQRGMALGGLLLAAAAGFGIAPYVTVAVLGLLALLVRTASWTGETARARQHVRGGRRWYDAPLTALTAPWFLLVAAGGTVMLLAWAGVVTAIIGLAVSFFRPPLTGGLFLLGVVFALGVWMGPGSKRLRRPTRRMLVVTTRDVWVGWTVVAAIAIVAVALLVGLSGGQVVWDPAPGAPWRSGTVLGDVLRWI